MLETVNNLITRWGPRTCFGLGICSESTNAKTSKQMKILNLILNIQMNRIHEAIPALLILPNMNKVIFAPTVRGGEEERRECSTVVHLLLYPSSRMSVPSNNV
jgi:hypothetical protein